MARNRRFEVVMPPTDFDRLTELSHHYSLSKGAIVRLALRDLFLKIGGTGQLSSVQEPLLKSAADNPPPELDTFWKDFRA